MKRVLIYILLLVSLSACAGPSFQNDKSKCSKGGEVCIKIEAEEPIQYDTPINVTITVVVEKDIPELQVGLTSFPPVKVYDQNKWSESGARWVIVAQEKQTYVFTPKVQLPPDHKYFELSAGAYAPNITYISDMVSIFMTQEGGKVYHSGTAIPITSAPLRPADEVMQATLRAIPTKSPYPTLTPAPPTLPPKEVSTPAGKAYPPPYP
jgi:hypothetical protein